MVVVASCCLLSAGTGNLVSVVKWGQMEWMVVPNPRHLKRKTSQSARRTEDVSSIENCCKIIENHCSLCNLTEHEQFCQIKLAPLVDLVSFKGFKRGVGNEYWSQYSANQSSLGHATNFRLPNREMK